MGTPVYWPSDLGDIPIQYGMQRQLTSENDIDVTEVDSGEVRRRQKYYTSVVKMNITFSFTDEQMQQFTVFYMHDLYKGTKAFQARVPHAYGSRIYRCRFDPASYRDQADTFNRWTVTITMELRDLAIWDVGAQWLLDLYDNDIPSMLNGVGSIHNALHVLYPTAVRDDMYV